MQQEFVPGQRWVSEAEPDLGLGVVEEVNERHVRISFAAAGQTRNYALRDAPLSRVRLHSDDRVEDQDGRPLTVKAVDEVGGLLFYLCEDADGGATVLAEQALHDQLRLNRPQDKLLSRRIDPDAWFTLRYQGWRQAANLWHSPVYGLQGPRIDLLPHQLFIAAEVSARRPVRVLLADEVGLGKTIEAGLIMHRLILTERVQRVLIVVPDALVNQWLVEMLRRFNLAFAVFDDVRFAGADRGNPFLDEQRVLCSLSFLTSDGAVARAVVKGEWDLLVVDEAHHLTWSEQDTGLAYQLVEALAAQTLNVLLLTATPEQLGRAGHFGRLRLLDPQRFHDYPAFIAEEQAYGPVAEIAASLLDGKALSTDQQVLLGDLLGDESLLPIPRVIERLIDRHGTGRVLFRNTRHAIKGFPRRRLHGQELACPPQYAQLAALPNPEQAYGEGWVTIDPRVAWLRELLVSLAPQKVLVICAHAATAIALRDFLLERCALHAAMFHERMEIVARDRAAAFFADPDDGSQVLICSEIGSEGRNFQFAHHLVLFDLPIDPDLLEQRIGRLDRIGQRATIELHVPYLSATAGEVLMRWYRDGLASFEAVCAAASAVHAALREELLAALEDPARTTQLVEQAARLTARLNARLEAGRDRLLELHSYQPAQAARLVDAVHGQDEVVPLRRYLEAYWDAFGLEHEPGPGHSTILRPGAHMLHDQYPGLGSEPLTVTFERGNALMHEDRQFLTWEHPLVRGSLDMLISGELGSAAISVCQQPGFRAGSVLLETLYVVECTAPPGLELQRYLPPTCIRYLLDSKGADRADEIPHEALQGLCLSRNRKLADTVLKSQRARIKALLALAQQQAESDGAALGAQARSLMESQLGEERQRLEALARVNPNVQDVEIEQIALRSEMLAEHLDQALVRLDAIRVVVMR